MISQPYTPVETSDQAHPDDVLLWNQFRKSDPEAFATLYRRYVGVLYNYGYHIVADADVIQDAIQDLFIDLWRTRTRLSPTTSVKFYLFRSLRRRLHQATELGSRGLTLHETAHFASVPSHEMAYILQEEEETDRRKLQQVLRQLPARQHEAIRLRFFDNFSWEEVAAIMQMNEQSVRNLVQRAVKKMRGLFGLSLLVLLVLRFIA